MVHTTNYTDTFIEISEDSKLAEARVPPAKNEQPSIARMQYDRLSEQPYRWTSDDLIFDIYAERQGVPKTAEARTAFYSKGQPCLRTSPLAKSHGYGFHFDDQSRVALYAVESDDYKRMAKDPSLAHMKAMRSKREK